MDLLQQLQSELNPGCTMMVNNADEETFFLSSLTPDMRVLEFGMGLSTLAIAAKVKEVVSIEHNHGFFKAFRGQLPTNAHGVFVAANAEPRPDYDDGTFEDFQDYVKSPLLFNTPKFDVVLVDGRSRVACAEYAAKHYLKEGGIIFIHDYKHPNPHYRNLRLYLEDVEKFLKPEKQVFTMAMFTVREEIVLTEPAAKEMVLGDQQPIGFEQVLQTITDEQDIDDDIARIIEGQVAKLKEQFAEPKGEQPADSDSSTPAPEKVQTEVQTEVSETVVTEQKQEPAQNTEQKSEPIPADTVSCWHQPQTVTSEMNRFYDLHIKGHDIAEHMSAFTRLLMATDKQGSDVIDLGCGTAMLSEFCKEFKYFGADLSYVIADCAMRNFPDYYYRSINIETDDLSWLKKYPVVITSGIIDVMQHPLETLVRILENTSEYLIVHRQDISEAKPTQIEKGPGYGDFAWHSIINRKELLSTLDALNFDIVKEEKLKFDNWEDGGRSLLLRKRKSWALYGIDHKLSDILGNRENGFFIEAGANDGLRQSNTMFFEFYKNWYGILIEPVPALSRDCRQNRSPRNFYVEAALVGPDYEGETIDLYYTPENNGLLTTVVNEKAPELMKRVGSEEVIRITASVITFNRLIEQAREHKYIPEKIDLMVLDLEGQEFEVLKGIDFEKHNIEYLLVEELNRTTEISEYLSPWYKEEMVLLSGHDVLYKRK